MHHALFRHEEIGWAISDIPPMFPAPLVYLPLPPTSFQFVACSIVLETHIHRARTCSYLLALNLTRPIWQSLTVSGDLLAVSFMGCQPICDNTTKIILAKRIIESCKFILSESSFWTCASADMMVKVCGRNKKCTPLMQAFYSCMANDMEMYLFCNEDKGTLDLYKWMNLSETHWHLSFFFSGVWWMWRAISWVLLTIYSSAFHMLI